MVVVHGDQADGGVAHALQLGVLGDVAGTDELDAGVAHAERAVGLHHRRGVIAGGHEDEEHVRLLVLGALEERREVRHCAGAAHRDLVDDLAAVGLEAALEGVQAVLAGREIGVADHRGLGLHDLGGGLAHAEAGVPHAERRPHVLRRHVGDVGGARVHDHGELLAGGDDRRRCDRVRGIDPAREHVDLVLGEQLLHRDLGVGAARVLGVALDQRDLVGLHLVGVELEILLDAAVDQLGELGADSGVGQHHPDLDLLGLDGAGRSQEQERRQGRFERIMPFHVFPSVFAGTNVPGQNTRVAAVAKSTKR